jgi:hypothetical protein
MGAAVSVGRPFGLEFSGACFAEGKSHGAIFINRKKG